MYTSLGLSVREKVCILQKSFVKSTANLRVVTKTNKCWYWLIKINKAWHRCISIPMWVYQLYHNNVIVYACWKTINVTIKDDYTEIRHIFGAKAPLLLTKTVFYKTTRLKLVFRHIVKMTEQDVVSLYNLSIILCCIQNFLVTMR